MAAAKEDALPDEPRKRQRWTLGEVVVGWALENGAIWAMVGLRMTLLPHPRQDSLLEQVAFGLLGSLLCVELGMLVHHFYASVVFAHLPYFSKNPQQFLPDAYTALKSWAGCNFVAVVLAFCVLFPAMRDLPKEQWEASLSNELRPGVIFTGLVAMRLVSDVVFYIVHRLEHTPQLYWLHKRHHMHTTCHAVGTNLNFHFLDIMLEGFLPPFIGLKLFELLGHQPSMLEFNVYFAYILWYETGSHAGKELPTVSYFPPLSLITRPLGLDDDNVLFHDNHHRLNNCNFGITQWCDWLAGSRNVDASAER